MRDKAYVKHRLKSVPRGQEVASYNAIAATSQAIIGLLRDARSGTEFDNAQFELFQATDFKKIDFGVSLYLYRIGPSSRRYLPPRTGPNGKPLRPPLPIDLYYMLTPWAQTAERQQRLLGWIVRTLEDSPILPAGVLNHYVSEADTFRLSESVELIYEPLSLQDMTSIWDIFKPNLPVSVTYVARMIAVESTIEQTTAEPVQTRVFDYAKAGV
jgi:hypothetical protein